MSRWRVGRENCRRSWLLVEVEVGLDIAELAGVFTHVRSGIRSSVGLRVKTLSVQEVVFDELRVGVEAQRLMVDVPGLGVRADDHRGDAQSVSEGVDGRGNDVIVEAAPVV